MRGGHTRLRKLGHIESERQMRYVGYGRGRSSATFIWKDEYDKTYPMFMSEMDRLIETITITKGYIGFHTWTIVKRGANYSLSLVNHADS